MSYHVAIVVLFSTATSVFATCCTLRAARGQNWGSRIEAHHSRGALKPRFGGIGLVVGFVITEFFLGLAGWDQPFPLWGVIASLAMFGLGLWDDFTPLRPAFKLTGQVLVSLALCAFGIGVHCLKFPLVSRVVELGGWGVPLTVLWLVGMTNLINFIDGMDGLAAGVSLILMVLLGYVGHETGSFELEASGLAGALLGFLYYNLPPARIYMGDGGSYFLGFQIGLLALLNSHKGEVCAALAAPMLVLALPLLDTTLSILRRGLRGLPIYRADRCHLHHQLLRSGFSRGQVLAIFYGLTFVFLLTGMTLYRAPWSWQPALLALVIVLLAGRAGAFFLKWNRADVVRGITNALRSRHQVRSALRLARLLERESRRRESIDRLWPELVSVARQLGFVSLRLTLSDGTRYWERPDFRGQIARVEAELPDARLGTIELAAPLQSGQACGSVSFKPNPHDFRILAEILVEAWMNATLPFLAGSYCSLAFSYKNPLLGRANPGRLKPCFVPGIRAETTPQAVSCHP